jgi:hypothetical protein
MSDGSMRGSPFGGPSVRDDVEREIQSHLALRADELVPAGWDQDEARIEAERLFGDRAAISRECRRVTERHQRAVRRAKMWRSVWQDTKNAVRGWRGAQFLPGGFGRGAERLSFDVAATVYEEDDLFRWTPDGGSRDRWRSNCPSCSSRDRRPPVARAAWGCSMIRSGGNSPS